VRRSGGAATAAAAAVLVLCACGSARPPRGPRGQDASYPVAVTRATFPVHQRLAGQADLVISVKNTGTRTIPDIAVTIFNPRYGTAAGAFDYDINANPGEVLASRSRPIWIVDRPPGPCSYSCANSGPGAGASVFSNTWALGPLSPGRTATFDWRLTAVRAGHWTVAYAVAANLRGDARAVTVGGRHPQGSFAVNISPKPVQAYVNGSGQIVTSG
jgi:hypothetical protein